MTKQSLPLTLQYGLTAETVLLIQEVFKKHPKILKAILYGSRAKGNYKNTSDIDLTLQGTELDYVELVVIENELDDLLLPYTIDLSLYHQIGYADLIEHIDRVGKAFYLNQSRV